MKNAAPPDYLKPFSGAIKRLKEPGDETLVYSEHVYAQTHGLLRWFHCEAEMVGTHLFVVRRVSAGKETMPPIRGRKGEDYERS